MREKERAQQVSGWVWPAESLRMREEWRKRHPLDISAELGKVNFDSVEALSVALQRLMFNAS